MIDLKSLIREVPDFPKPGINFYDITTLLKDPQGWKATIDALKARYEGIQVDVVVGIEARGFFFAPAIAYALGAGFVPVRKPGKLPAETETIEYALEYGTDKLQIHKDAIQPGMRVLIIDDVLATGGTASAVAQLIERLGAQVLGLGFLVELDFLNGKAKLEGREVYSVLHY
jgi:adenine phosphoribosyltransferase